MEPFIAEIFAALNTGEISGGLDRDIIRRVAKDHALADEDSGSGAGDTQVDERFFKVADPSKPQPTESDVFEFAAGAGGADSSADGDGILLGLMLSSAAGNGDGSSRGDGGLQEFGTAEPLSLMAVEADDFLF